jgi:hypothetical protein
MDWNQIRSGRATTAQRHALFKFLSREHAGLINAMSMEDADRMLKSLAAAAQRTTPAKPQPDPETLAILLDR